MKHNDIKNLTTGKISPINYENMFNVFEENEILDEKYYYNILKTIIVPENLDESYYFDYIVQGGETYPMISNNIYGDPRGWWLICIANNIHNPISFPQAGLKLKILNRNVAKSILSKISNGGA